MTDHDLLRQYVQGSPDALSVLVQRHSGMVHATALRELKDTNLADDVTQAVFLVLMKRAASLSTQVIIGGWLFKTTRFAVADLKKKRARQQYHEREATAMTDARETAGDDAEVMPALNDALSSLPTGDRDAIVLRYLEGRSGGELATALGTSEEAARQRVSRAIGRLRKILMGKGLVLSLGGLMATLEGAHLQICPAALGAQLESLVRGAVPASRIESLVQGVLAMLRHAQIVTGAAVAGIVCALVSVGVVVAANVGTPAAIAPAAGGTVAVAAPTAPAATVPAAASKYGPALTPKGTLEAAFAAAMDGDAEGIIACFNNPSDTDKIPLRNFAVALAGLNSFSKAVEKQFGKEALAQLNQSRVMGGLNPTEIGAATETISNDRAIVDIGKSGPEGGIPMMKVGNVWKIDSVVLHTLNVEAVAASARLGPALDQVAKDIEAKKYATVGAAFEAAQALLRSPQQPAQLP